MGLSWQLELLSLLLLLTAFVELCWSRATSRGHNSINSLPGYSDPYDDQKGWEDGEQYLEESEECRNQPGAGTNSLSGKDKLEHFGEILKGYVAALRETSNRKVELAFLMDGSGSVGEENFGNELKFVRKMLADFAVDTNTTRVAVITFSSRSRVIRHIDHMTNPSDELHKCSLLEEELPKILYTGGGTYTKGALLEAQVTSKTCMMTSTENCI